MLQIEIIGNLGNDAEIKSFNGKQYLSFTVAHSEKRKNADGMTVESTTWVSVLKNDNGGGLAPYLKRGAKVYVRGRLSVKPYQSSNGWCAGINCHCDYLELCGLKQDGASGSIAQQDIMEDNPL